MAEMANFPFCTIEPNVATVPVRDARLTKLTEMANSERSVPTGLEFIDIAGLVKGASDGKGMGNKFLTNVRSTSAIAHVVRCFQDEDVIHVRDGQDDADHEAARTLDPVLDLAIIEGELVLADLQSAELQLAKARKGKGKASGAAGVDPAAALAFLEGVCPALEEGQPAAAWLQEKHGGEQALAPTQLAAWRSLALMTQKPAMVLCNVDEAAAGPESSDLVRAVEEWVAAERPGCPVVRVCAPLELELGAIEDEEERAEYLAAMGLAESALASVQAAAMRLLNRRVYFTTGPQETRAWLVRAGTLAPQAAGVIHSDLEKGFIRAEVIGYDDYVACGSEKAAKEAGKMRSEGKDYEVQDGDVMHFRHNT
ncbi:hypothetical protein FNF29_03564 [Cafeteria roenbergensis]|nr:hypothetical protein FNF29_03564 [Cafeteria roenbergensis]|eukprot:KAA0153045.1 hypothetical protein FNF29_03564 [Cafeteria roenbergensis]